MLTFPLFLDGGSGGRETQRSALQVQVHPFNLSQLITQTRNPTDRPPSAPCLLFMVTALSRSAGPLLCRRPPCPFPRLAFASLWEASER